MPELAQELIAHLAAVRRPVRLDLVVVPLQELPGGDVPALDFGDHLAGERADANRGGIVQETGDVEDDERQDDEAKAPLEPAFVATHPVEHGHGRTSARPP